MARQNDGCLDPFPIWDDVRTFDGRAWEGCVDVVTAGWPCTDISVAGRGAGIEGEQSGLWTEVARILAEVRPRACLLENSPALTTRGLGTVLGDLATLGFATEHGVLGAHHAGAPHRRDRMWIVGVADADRAQREGRRLPIGTREEHADACSSGWWATEPNVGRVADGVAARVDRLKCIGNGQVPAVAALAWQTLVARLEGT